jgi:hypothetical protein
MNRRLSLVSKLQFKKISNKNGVLYCFWAVVSEHYVLVMNQFIYGAHNIRHARQHALHKTHIFSNVLIEAILLTVFSF